MDEPMTCGQGLAEQSAMPAKFGSILSAVARILELHTSALDPRNESAKRELIAYRELAEAHLHAAEVLASMAARMAGYRDLPMAPHDEEAMRDPDLTAAFREFVDLENELHGLLQARLASDNELLASMEGAGSS
jgi:hypothetical protein